MFNLIPIVDNPEKMCYNLVTFFKGVFKWQEPRTEKQKV